MSDYAFTCVRARAAFHEGNMTGVLMPEDGKYLVLSYSTVIAVHTAEDGWTLDDTKYSRTTSRHQNIVRKVADFEALLDSGDLLLDS